MHEIVVDCGDALARGAPSDCLHLSIEGAGHNVALRISDLTRRMVRNLPPHVADLVEVAAYVYAADIATSRGGPVSRAMGRDWRRAFQFFVPVREPDHWNDTSVRLALSNALTFLSDDSFEFEFLPKAAADGLPEYLDLDEKGISFKVDEVVLFSGGLDSLAGAIEELSSSRKKVALISHRPSSKIYDHQKQLVASLRSTFSGRIMHVPVLAHREDPLPVHEYTQRTRSFLYAALASAVSALAGLKRIRFFENGIVSMNLPIAEQIVGARATRTTHPLALSLLSTALGQILKSEFSIENPFIWSTKSDIVRKVVDAGFGRLIRHSVSCSHVHEMTREKTHCGCCSQCIDRRFGILAAGATPHDPASQYVVDLLEGPREAGIERTMAEAFVRSRLDMSRMTDAQ